MRVIEVIDPQVWDSFVQAHAQDSGFLQSFAWGEFQKSVGRTVVRLGIVAQASNDLQAVALMVQHPLLLGYCYWYSPRGPIIAKDGTISMRVLDAYTHHVNEISQAPRILFWRMDSAILGSAGSCVSLQHLGFCKAPHEMQPKSTLIIDLTKSEEQLLAEMHQKTRYNIHLAERKGVIIQGCHPERSEGSLANAREPALKDCDLSPIAPFLDKSGAYAGDSSAAPQNDNRGQFESFWSLLQETAKRDRFRTHAKEYYEKLLKIGSERMVSPKKNGIAGRAGTVSPDQGRGTSEAEIRADASTLGSRTEFFRGDAMSEIPSVELFVTEHEGKTLAAAIVAFFNNWALYLHGASSSESREYMAPHLLHWRIMQHAKARGCTKYDLWGADSARWPGVTRFKQGFAEETPITSYCGAWDYPMLRRAYKMCRGIVYFKDLMRH